jgi:hypothetical protein
MIIMRNSLARGNKNVNNALKETKHDKTKTYDKIISMMLDTCTGTIEDRTVDKILQSEDVNVYDNKFEKYLQFNKNVFQIIGPQLQNTPSEKVILDDIQRVLNKPGIEIPIEEEKYDYLTEKFGRYKYFVIGLTIGFSMFLVFILFFNMLTKKNI